MFLAAVGIVGWAAVVCAARDAVAPPLGVALLFSIVIVGARALAFPLGGRLSPASGPTGGLGPDDGAAEVSLDAGIFVAAAVCLGPGVAGLGVATVIAADVVRRGLAARRRRQALGRTDERSRDAGGRLLRAAYRVIGPLYLGGLSGGSVVLSARALGVERGDGRVYLVPLLGASVLVAHALVRAVAERVAGRSLAQALKRNAVGVLAEATLLPLAAAIVLTYDPARPGAFALLGCTYLLVNLGFHRLAHLAVAMRRRAVELETLNRTAHALGSSLELPQVISALLRETGHALPYASRLSAVVRAGGEVKRYWLDPKQSERQVIIEPADDEARAWLKRRELALETEVPTESGRLRARLVVPFGTWGETVGVLVAETRAGEVFGENELRLLDAIGGQAAAAVENARLYGLANVDGLTGLYCRRYFDTRIAEEIERARRFDSSFALLLLDLDDFKRLNDTLGHLAGDRALREVAAIAASQLRGVDLAARYGGEELAFLLPRTSLEDARAVAERIREAVAHHTLVDGRRSVRVTISIGVAGFRESGIDDAATLLARADAALYRAKHAGKNRVECDLVDFELSPSLAPVRRRRQGQA